MMLIFGLMLLQTASCMEFNCRFDQKDPCYAALDHKLNLPMVDARNYKLKIIKRINNNRDDPVCKVKNDSKTDHECDLYSNRPEVTVINGTLIINRVIRADSGNYTLDLYRSDGTETSADLQVKVEAPIGSVEVSIICSSSGVKSVSCSSDGDQLIYSWTLNGDPLMDGDTSIELNDTTHGDIIICSLKNHVSHGQKSISLDCPGMEFNCRFDQKDPCYAALDHKLNLQMVDARNYRLKIIKRINNNTDDPVCKVKNDNKRETKCDLYNNRPEVTVINGNLIINRVIRADSGNYTLDLYRSDGSVTSAHLQVKVEAPIGSVNVSIICSSSGVKSVSCSSDGDQLIYSWTLNGDPLMDGDTSIELNDTTHGDIIICSVKNHVSHRQKSISVEQCPGMEFNCRFDQKDPCYAALDHKLNLQMVDARNYKLKIIKRINNNTDNPVCKVKNDSKTENECDLYNNRPEVTVINGNLIINRVIRADSGNYTLQLDRSDGSVTSADLQVKVEAPIGSVEVSIICSSSGVKSVSCSSDGDQLIYSWTLNGDPLMDGDTSIELKDTTHGDIICSVKNHVSHGQKSISVEQCPGMEFNCRFDQKDPCYAALDHKLNLQMVDARNYKLKIIKRINNNRDNPACKVKNDSKTENECDLYYNRPEVTVINGNLIINRVIRADSGNYTLQLDRSDGSVTSADLQVKVEAPIGSVEVSIICSSSGVKSVSCSSDGDQLIYSWTLNGDPLMDGDTSIELNDTTHGDIICGVKNHVSHGQKNISVEQCPGMEFNCRFDQKDPCYAALDHKLNLQMVDARNYKLKIIKRIKNTDNPVCKVKNDSKTDNECDLYNNRPEVTVINGTLIINRVIRADSGNYTLQLDRSDGSVTSADLQVKVEAPIGSVEVSIICSSSGVKSVSCSSDGDQLIYSWTLNGDPLMDGNTSIELNDTTHGDIIICSVKNHVSHGQKSISLEQCPGTTTAAVTSRMTSTLTNSTHSSGHVGNFPSEISHYMIILGCVALVLILLFITACHFYKRKQLKSTPAPAGDTELVYAQISHEKHNKKSGKKKQECLAAADVEYAAVGPQTKRKERKEEEVQYGEVMFTPNHSNAHQEPKEECLYSQVQRR
ncbi:unnamed protein product [Leuciscus chuanchicus]